MASVPMVAFSRREPVDMAGFRGPEPPFAVCHVCGATSEHPWTNPLLVELKRLGMHDGEVTGGWLLCASPCAQKYDAEQRAKRSEALMVPGMPAEFRGATLDNYEMTRGNVAAVKAAKAFIAGVGDLYLCGGVGSGKTRLACSIANAALRAHGSVAFVRVAYLLMQLQEAMHSPDEHTKLSDYVNPALLVLDDVGVEKGTDYSRRVLTTLYDRRLDLGRRTIWTSNGSLEDLAAALDDERLPSRIAGASDVVYIGGDDRRLEAAERRVKESHRP
jgi:DNA replication protein DnaC